MTRTASLALLCLLLFLVALPLALHKPGLPGNLKADEPAYYLMALSLARDGDLRCEPRDLRRLLDEFPGGASNLILASDDGWRTVYFGKPYVYSALAAPWAAAFGANGLLALNMALVAGMVALGASYLRRWNPPGLAALFSAGYFLLSAGFAYAFWLHPEVLNMASVTAALHLGLAPPPPGRGARQAVLRAALSGAALAVAVYNKPMLGAVGLPLLLRWAARRELRAALAWCAAAAAALLLLCAGSWALTGHPSAYLGWQRSGHNVRTAEALPVSPVEAPAADAPLAVRARNSWFWLLRVPRFDPRALAEDLGYFLWGRHVGLLLYQPLALLALLLFLLHARRSRARWLLLAALAAVAVYFVLWVPDNWHGGGGFVGNRYFVNLYPAFLFLVTRVSPAWLLAPAAAAAGLLLGPLLLTPFGAPVAYPTLQAHVRNFPFDRAPLELPLRRLIPGYRSGGQGTLSWTARRDAVLARGDELWTGGASRVELLLESPRPLGSLVLVARSPAAPNEVRLAAGGRRARLRLERADEPVQAELGPLEPDRVRRRFGETSYLYRLVVRSRTGAAVPSGPGEAGGFFLGAAIAILGTGEELRADLYRVGWEACEAPAGVAPGECFEATARLWNRSAGAWPAAGPARVHLSYHWLDADGFPVLWDGARTPLQADVPPGSAVATRLEVIAPDRPGLYTLALDPVRERVAWFSERNGGDACAMRVRVDGGGAP